MALKREGIHVRLKWKEGKKREEATWSVSKRRILNKIQALPTKGIDYYDIHVTYKVPGRRGLTNAGRYDKKKDLMLAYRAFTAKTEINQIFKDWRKE